MLLLIIFNLIVPLLSRNVIGDYTAYVSFILLSTFIPQSIILSNHSQFFLLLFSIILASFMHLSFNLLPLSIILPSFPPHLFLFTSFSCWIPLFNPFLIRFHLLYMRYIVCVQTCHCKIPISDTNSSLCF